jgi:hypothetical protein
MKITLEMALDYFDFVVSKNRSDQHLTKEKKEKG